MNCVVCGKRITRTFQLCSACLEQYGDRSAWPPWLKFLASDERRQRRTNSEWQRVEADDEIEYAVDESGEDGLRGKENILEVAALVKAAGLNERQITAVVLNSIAEWSLVEMAELGLWPTPQAAGICLKRALEKLREAAKQQEDLMDKYTSYTVRVNVAISWTGIDAPGRPEAQKIAEDLTRRLVGQNIETPDGVSLRKDDITISTNSIVGPSHPRRPMMAWEGFPDGGVAFDNRQPIELGVPR